MNKMKKAWIFWLARRLPTCEQLLPVMSQSLDRKLGFRERFVLRLHNSFCEWCLRYLNQLKLMRDVLYKEGAVSESSEKSSGPSLSIEARERMKRALK